LRNIKLLLQYDGTNYHGWQKQPGMPTIQGALEDAVRRITGEEVSITGASRTDKGVHALGQVASFLTQSELPADILARALDAKLPEDIAILSAEDVKIEFNARHSALGKWYRYFLLCGRKKSPFLSRYCALFADSLDAERMREATKILIGTHNFSAFGAQVGPDDDTVCTLQSIEIAGCMPTIPASSPEKLLAIDVKGDRFLYKMVRTVCGTLFEVGRGRWEPQVVNDILQSGDRHRAGQTLPACGLFLMEVRYR
jgi:tRNA pseudouridine38-40 synthase